MSFETTRWSLVVAAGGDDSLAARAALAALCESYWYPLYAYIRRWGAGADDAGDLTQAFLASLLERTDFKGLHQRRRKVLVPGGLITRLLGLAVITRNGNSTTRWRSLTRTLVAWLPAIVWFAYLAASPRIQGWVPAPPSPLVGVGLAVAALSVGARWTVARPRRGVHDRLTGTWVVPR